MMKAALAVLVITASVPSFRRAGLGFTDSGTAFAKEALSEDQLSTIHAEKKLSVRELQSDAIPEGVDTKPLERYLATTTAEDPQEKEKAPAKKTQSTSAKAGTKASKDTSAANTGA
jgi:hypothetical protein